jgi:hypothetical protein
MAYQQFVDSVAEAAEGPCPYEAFKSVWSKQAAEAMGRPLAQECSSCRELTELAKRALASLGVADVTDEQAREFTRAFALQGRLTRHLSCLRRIYGPLLSAFERGDDVRRLWGALHRKCDDADTEPASLGKRNLSASDELSSRRELSASDELRFLSKMRLHS